MSSIYLSMLLTCSGLRDVKATPMITLSLSLLMLLAIPGKEAMERGKQDN
jgi:hypothetical protein